MKKLIDAFKANPSLPAALKVLKHSRQHPMSACFFPAELAEVEAFYQSAIGGK